MILYHGTNEERALKILLDNTIKKNIKRVHSYDKFLIDHVGVDLNTTDGYVYLTNHIGKAIEFSNITRILEKSNNICYIFKLDIPDNLLFMDEDEMRIQYEFPLSADIQDNCKEVGFNKSLVLYNSVCTKININLDNYNSSYIKLPIEDIGNFNIAYLKEQNYNSSDIKNFLDSISSLWQII